MKISLFYINGILQQDQFCISLENSNTNNLFFSDIKDHRSRPIIYVLFYYFITLKY